MRFVLDTNALWHRPLLDALAVANAPARLHEVVLPAVAYAERLRQIGHDPQRLAVFHAQLDAIGCAVEPFGADEARRVQPMRPADWEDHARDFLVAAHVHSDRIGITADTGPAWRGCTILDPDGATDAVERLAR